MSEHPQVRALEPAELRPAVDLFRGALHVAPVDDEGWQRGAALQVPGRSFGAFEDGPGGTELVGTATSFATRTAVPGGVGVHTAAVTRVGVRADRTRRGHLSALMRAQLADAAARGEVLATLRASETGIYGRFGYGVASRGRQVRVPGRSALRPGAPGGGPIRMLTGDRALSELPAVHDRLALRRPGGMTRPPSWWDGFLRGRLAEREYLAAAVHGGPHGDDGFAVWTAERDRPGTPATVHLLDLHAADAAGTAGLWRFLLGLDLVADVTAHLRPLDEDVDLLLADPRTFQVEGHADETWLRLLDVPAALAARAWGDAAPVVLRVRDALFPGNDGLVRIGPDGPKPVENGAAAPELECDVAALAMAYLGDRRPSELVATGWWGAHDADAAARADALFAMPGPVPWCGTFF